MTQQEITIIRKTWKIFRSINPDIVGDAFYSKLFADAPAVRRMFPAEMNAQYKKLVDMLSGIVANLDDISVLSEDIAAMARRHTEYGVRPGHYKVVGNALLWTLQQGLGTDWNPAVELAWRKCYQQLADAMIAAGERVEGEGKGG
ncbi:MAG: hypothetical protein JNL59_08255 [Chitinophagaceae bacterium]|nr:hypothetical protein [Chitinophagaceae bacterium]